MRKGPGQPARASARGSTAERKQAHLELCLEEDVGALTRTTLLEDVELVHDALPDLAESEIDTGVRWLGRRLRLPLLITGMTGGTAAAARINRDLATLASEVGIAFGVGSQRAMDEEPDLAWSFDVRAEAPDLLLLANIGIAQARTLPVARVARLVERIRADALCVHLNVAQELVQPEGDRDFRGGTAAISRLVRALDVPLVVKETGCGLSRSVAERLREAGVRQVDVAGAGGTSWVRVEGLRAPESAGVATVLRDWGIPTAASVLAVRAAGLRCVASGGIRSGLDVARALALGASMAGIALPVYQRYRAAGRAGARAQILEFERELRTVMLLTASRKIGDLPRAPRLIGPRLDAWRRFFQGGRADRTTPR